MVKVRTSKGEEGLAGRSSTRAVREVWRKGLVAHRLILCLPCQDLWLPESSPHVGGIIVAPITISLESSRRIHQSWFIYTWD